MMAKEDMVLLAKLLFLLQFPQTSIFIPFTCDSAESERLPPIKSNVGQKSICTLTASLFPMHSIVAKVSTRQVFSMKTSSQAVAIRV